MMPQGWSWTVVGEVVVGIFAAGIVAGVIAAVIRR
jgi:hypothetical protein